MKQYNVKTLAVIGLSGILFTACGGLGKMAKYAETITYNVDPNPLIVRGDSVELNINGNFPGKYFSKKAMVELTPKLQYGENSTPYEMVAFQGESAAGNATVIPYETGKNFTYSDRIAYSPAMETSELMLHITGKEGKKTKDFEPFKLADGVITTPYLVMNDDKALTSKHGFVRVTSHNSSAVINYLVNSSTVRPGELKDADVAAIDAFLKSNGTNPSYQFKGATVTAYASPEGEISLNENLATERATSASKSIESLMKKHKMQFDGTTFFNLVPKGEDWEGFKSKMQASSIADKELILRILEMYNDNSKREQEIKNLAATFEEIAEKILPELRRSEVTVNYDIVGKSDEEIIAMARSANAGDLNNAEMLYAATLTTDMNEQYAIFKKASETYPTDYRAFNNMGVIHLKKNESSQADAMFKKANEIKESQEANNNLGIVTRLNGDRKKASGLYNKATGGGDEVNYNLGIIDIQNGDYASAIQNMKGTNSFNKALAQVLSGQNDAAMTTLNQSPEKDTAQGQYLKAIIAARSNDGATVASALAQAFTLDASLKVKAQKDLEFRNFPDAVK